MLNRQRLPRGFTLIEVMISLVVLGVLLSLGAPVFADWLQNQQTRGAAEATLNGLQIARATAVQRNTPVRFQFVTDLTSACTLAPLPTNTSTTPVNWVVSFTNPTGGCNPLNPDTTPNANIVQARFSGEGTSNAVATPVYVPGPPAGVAAGANTVTFSALGSIVNPNPDGSVPLVRIDISNPRITSAAARPLRVIVTTGGSIRMCDPAVAGTDPRACPAFP
jgi:type IV fimbrial biogenesis protein FimT